MNQKPVYSSKLIVKASIIECPDKASLESKLQAAKHRYETGTDLEGRGKFPVGLVSQPDVLALQSVILTTGRPGNLNDDVMLNAEILPVLWTAALKPFNMEHTKFIIGTMTDAFAVDRDTGNVVQSIERFDEDESDEDRLEDKEELLSVIASFPENLDIITNQVLWSLHFPEQVREVKRKAVAGELFVSMELWFTSFDYLIGNRIVKRTPLLAQHLDPKLRINGGKGLFGLEKIKRIPRNIVFAGNAAVETPANPDSFILDVMDRSDLVDSREMVSEEAEAAIANENNADVLQLIADNTLDVLESLSDEDNVSEEFESNVGYAGGSGRPLGSEAFSSELISAGVGEVVTHSEELEMENEKKVVELLEKNAVLQSVHDGAVASLAEANKDKEVLQASNKELEAKLEETLALVKEKEALLDAKAEAFEKLEAEKVELITKLDDTSAELAEIEDARRLDVRKVALADLGLSEERVVKTLAKTAELSDDAFNVEVEDLKAFLAEFAPTILEKIEEVSVVDETVEETEEVAAASEEEISEVLEEVEEEETPIADAVGTVSVDVDTDEIEKLQSALAKALQVHL